MKVQICKGFTFDAAHWLPNVSDDHKCKQLHGHTYRVEVVCEGEPDDRGMIVDYAEIADEWAKIHAIVDHRCLNEINGLLNPTTEILAPWILARLTGLPVVAVRVYESSTTWCEVRRDLSAVNPSGTV